ncbi:ABC transporter permease [Emticicia sp. C21]|uniref:ABC transporter permease n=1 Tax=Emticicia sp. C21 TaxID=2302915 RepID=UPI000E340BD1|nr:nitrate ABC transporter permease [Emticicia sp. C21]RFS13892.1 nitrate ABC transporter permease [Emticicia sp. C21]
MEKIKKLFIPNTKNSQSTMAIMIAIQMAVFLVLWTTSSFRLIPTPMEILKSLQSLIASQNLIYELWNSTWLCLKSLLIATIISLIISYATVIPFFKPIGYLISKFRFWTLVGLSFVFTLITHSGHELKVTLMVFGITVFFVTSMVSIIQSIPKYEFYHARTLRMNEWQVVWEVIILGRLDQVLEVIRQNFAIAWMMLTMVEGISRAEGGIGVLLLNNNKLLRLSDVFAIQLVILLMGIFLDYTIGKLREFFFPYSKLTLEK